MSPTNGKTAPTSRSRGKTWRKLARKGLRQASKHRQALMAPAGSLVACAVMAAVPLMADVEDSWTRVTAQTQIAVDTSEFRLDAFEVRLDSLAQVNLEDKLALIMGTKKGEVREELECLAQNIYFEARSEPTSGKLAVAHVVMNRKDSKIFPGTVCDVVKDGGEKKLNRCQFSWWCDGKSDRITDMTAWKDSVSLASKVYWGRAADPTQGALWYHADYVEPYWRRAFKKGPKIGRHIFYSAKPKFMITQAEQPTPEVMSLASADGAGRTVSASADAENGALPLQQVADRGVDVVVQRDPLQGSAAEGILKTPVGAAGQQEGDAVLPVSHHAVVQDGLEVPLAVHGVQFSAAPQQSIGQIIFPTGNRVIERG